MWMAKFATVAGIVIFIGFLNAPVFAAFLLGMFWKRATGHSALFRFMGKIMLADIRIWRIFRNHVQATPHLMFWILRHPCGCGTRVLSQSLLLLF